MHAAFDTSITINTKAAASGFAFSCAGQELPQSKEVVIQSKVLLKLELPAVS
jgi:hypothetical protein